MLLPNALAAAALLSTLVAGIPIPNPGSVEPHWAKLQNVVLATKHSKPQPAADPAVLSPTLAKTRQNADLSQVGKNWAKVKNVLTATKQSKHQPAAALPKAPLARRVIPPVSPKVIKEAVDDIKLSPESREIWETLFKLQLDKSKPGMSRSRKDKWLWENQPIEKWPKNPSLKELFWPWGKKKPAAKPENPPGSPLAAKPEAQPKPEALPVGPA
ncbi:hypothetical protein HYALB_00008912 [Hymenoscyphus albidus]|uniref:Uncharacterized protein n=1 Tax=Hymenoscyphus albidus TaxID=595503 RepID=A0A9N9LV65_9HELO|nr:hypothetical protein HYALB_00008912 [Hymenoscyphus albidus]